MEKEIWKHVIGYEGIYMISSFGNVKSLDRKVINSVYNKGYAILHGKEMYKNKDKDGYLTVGFFKDKKAKTFKIHRLVALHFIPQINGKNIVNHKNGNKSDNHVENLEWCTNSENQIHSFKTLGNISSKRKLNENEIQDIKLNCKKGVNQFNKGNVDFYVKKYGVTNSTICNIINNKYYKNSEK